MKIDSVFKTKQGSAVRAEKSVVEVKRGDVLSARVLSNENGTARLRLQNGAVVNAQFLDGSVPESGEKLDLVVQDMRDGILYMALAESEGGTSTQNAQPPFIPADKAEAKSAELLRNLGYPVTRETLDAMHTILSQYPSVTPEEAAFIAANGMEVTPENLEAAARLLSGEGRTENLEKLLDIAVLPETAVETVLTAETPVQDIKESLTAFLRVFLPEAGDTGQRTGTALPYTENTTLPAENSAAAIAAPVESAAAQPDNAAAAQPDNAAAAYQENSAAEHQVINTPDSPQTSSITAQGDPVSANVSQSTPSAQDGTPVQANPPGIAHQTENTVQTQIFNNTPINETPELRQISPESQAPVTYETRDLSVSQNAVSVENSSGIINNGTITVDSQNTENTESAGNAVSGSGTEISRTAAEISRTAAETPDNPGFSAARDTLAKTLAEIPELKGMPPRRLNSFADALIRAGIDAELYLSPENGEISQQKITVFLEKLFPEITGGARREGLMLKSSREELPARLALLEEAVSRANTPSKNALLEHTRQIRQDERLWNGVEHYVYTQIPVTLNGEHRTAELYVYKRRREQKKLDPENVNILLAVDLPHAGHIEAFAGIMGRGVSLQISVENEETRILFENGTPKLYSLLDGIGYRLDNMKVSCDDKIETEPLSALSVPSAYVRQPGLDIRI